MAALGSDIHFCGNCKSTFTDVHKFVQHKSHCQQPPTAEAPPEVAVAPSTFQLQQLVRQLQSGMMKAEDMEVLQAMALSQPTSSVPPSASSCAQGMSAPVKNEAPFSSLSFTQAMMSPDKTGPEEAASLGTQLVQVHTVDGTPFTVVLDNKQLQQLQEQPVSLPPESAPAAVGLPAGVPGSSQQAIPLYTSSQGLSQPVHNIPGCVVVNNAQPPQPQTASAGGTTVQELLTKYAQQQQQQSVTLTVQQEGDSSVVTIPAAMVTQLLSASTSPNSPAPTLEINAGSGAPLQITLTPSMLGNILTGQNSIVNVVTAPAQPAPVASPAAKTKPTSIVKKRVKRYYCEDCNYSTNTHKDMKRHKHRHQEHRPLKCEFCEKSFYRQDKLRLHIRTHTGERPYKCTLCEYRCADKCSLTKHMRIHNDERPYQCQICSYASRNSSQLSVHLRTHTGDAPFVCSLCQASFKITSDLKRHLRIHTGDKPYKCLQCDYSCAIKSNLKSHTLTNHNAENATKCEECEFVTSSSKQLREHMKLHDSNPSKLTCDICQYICSSRSVLRMHLRGHNKERPFKCQFCSYSAKQSGNCRLHMKNKHPASFNAKDLLSTKKGDPKPEPLNIEPGDMASSSVSRKATKRKGRRPHVCPLCGVGFVGEGSLRSHVRTHKEKQPGAATAPSGEYSLQYGGHDYVAQFSENTVIQSSLVDSTSQVEAPQNEIKFTNQPEEVMVVDDYVSHQSNMVAAAAATFVSESQLIAHLENNQNRAIEDNMHNQAVSQQSAPPPAYVTTQSAAMPRSINVQYVSAEMSGAALNPKEEVLDQGSSLEILSSVSVQQQQRRQAEQILSLQTSLRGATYHREPPQNTLEASNPNSYPQVSDNTEQQCGSLSDSQPQEFCGPTSESEPPDFCGSMSEAHSQDFCGPPSESTSPDFSHSCSLPSTFTHTASSHSVQYVEAREMQLAGDTEQQYASTSTSTYQQCTQQTQDGFDVAANMMSHDRQVSMSDHMTTPNYHMSGSHMGADNLKTESGDTNADCSHNFC